MIVWINEQEAIAVVKRHFPSASEFDVSDWLKNITILRNHKEPDMLSKSSLLDALNKLIQQT